VAIGLLQTGAEPCGCFGARSDTPVTPLHVGVTASCLAVGLVTSVTGGAGLFRHPTDLPAWGLPWGLLVATGTVAVVAALTVVPEVLSAIGLSDANEGTA
jgi:hypothetical protein